MALYQSKQVKAGVPALSATEASCPLAVVGEFLTVAGLTANDVIEMVALPAGTVPIDVAIACEDLDTGGTPAIVLDVGVLSGNYAANDSARTCGAEFINDTNIGQAGGMASANVAAGLLLTPTLNDRSIGVKIQTAAATLATGKKIRVVALCAPAPVGIDVAA
jgi:hypothetical protein